MVANCRVRRAECRRGPVTPAHAACGRAEFISSPSCCSPCCFAPIIAGRPMGATRRSRARELETLAVCSCSPTRHRWLALVRSPHTWLQLFAFGRLLSFVAWTFVSPPQVDQFSEDKRCFHHSLRKPPQARGSIMTMLTLISSMSGGSCSCAALALRLSRPGRAAPMRAPIREKTARVRQAATGDVSEICVSVRPGRQRRHPKLEPAARLVAWCASMHGWGLLPRAEVRKPALGEFRLTALWRRVRRAARGA